MPLYKPQAIVRNAVIAVRMRLSVICPAIRRRYKCYRSRRNAQCAIFIAYFVVLGLIHTLGIGYGYGHFVINFADVSYFRKLGRGRFMPLYKTRAIVRYAVIAVRMRLSVILPTVRRRYKGYRSRRYRKSSIFITDSIICCLIHTLGIGYG